MTDQPFNNSDINSFPSATFYPPRKLVLAWERRHKEVGHIAEIILQRVANHAAQYGADQELEACCKTIFHSHGLQLSQVLRNDRRPELPNLKEEALAVLNDTLDQLDVHQQNIIRRALEMLPND